MKNLNIRLIETPEEMRLVEELQRNVWPGSETDVVPLHMLITAVHNGGLVLGAFIEEKIVGFVFDIGLEVQFGIFIYSFIVLWWWKWLKQ